MDTPLFAIAGEEGLLFGADIPMARLFDLVGEYIGEDHARVRLPYRADLANSRGDVHGGAFAMLFDSTLACAARAHDPTRYGVVTIDLVTHFLAPCASDVIATAWCDRRGRNLCFARGEARDTQGQLLAIATGTFKLVDRRPAARVPRPPEPLS